MATISKPILVKRKAWIGAGATVLPDAKSDKPQLKEGGFLVYA
jgi:hypothetical protein